MHISDKEVRRLRKELKGSLDKYFVTTEGCAKFVAMIVKELRKGKHGQVSAFIDL